MNEKKKDHEWETLFAYKVLVDEVASQYGGFEFNKRTGTILEMAKPNLTVEEFKDLEEYVSQKRREKIS